MKRSIRFTHAALGGLAAASLMVGTTDAAATKPTAPDVPGKIAVPEGHTVFLAGHAVGVQIYSCVLTPTGHSWGLQAPRVDLYDDKGKLIITHFGGPSWQARDGSTVVGRRVDGVTVDETAIQWLLLERASSTEGPSGGDRLTETTFIQRTATTGGLPPTPETCNASTTGETKEIAYTADYHFWKQSGE